GEEGAGLHVGLGAGPLHVPDGANHQGVGPVAGDGEVLPGPHRLDTVVRVGGNPSLAKGVALNPKGGRRFHRGGPPQGQSSLVYAYTHFPLEFLWPKRSKCGKEGAQARVQLLTRSEEHTSELQSREN